MDPGARLSFATLMPQSREEPRGNNQKRPARNYTNPCRGSSPVRAIEIVPNEGAIESVFVKFVVLRTRLVFFDTILKPPINTDEHRSVFICAHLWFRFWLRFYCAV